MISFGQFVKRKEKATIEIESFESMRNTESGNAIFSIVSKKPSPLLPTMASLVRQGLTATLIDPLPIVVEINCRTTEDPWIYVNTDETGF